MPCNFSDPLSCPGDIIKGGASSLANSAFNSIVKSFVSAFDGLLQAFAKAFVAIPPVNLTSPGIKSVYGISLGVAGIIAALLLFGQVIRTAVTHDGSALVQGLIGTGKAALAFMLTLTIAGTALKASDELTNYIVVRSFGSTKALTKKITHLIDLHQPAGIVDASALLLLLAVVGILLVLVLWFELLLRNAAIAVLVATSPIAAAGQVSESTRSWWTKTAVSTGQLIVLKPVIALVFALGFGMTGQSKDIQSLLTGMLVLILAVFAWPAIARFFAFASVAVGGSAGLGALLGVAAGKAGGGGGGGAPTGVDPDQFSQAAEARTMASAGEGGSAAAAGGASAGGAGGAAAAGAAAAAGPLAVVLAGVQAAQKAVNTLSGGMDQMAGHAGMNGSGGAYAAGAPTSGSGGQLSGDYSASGEPAAEPPPAPAEPGSPPEPEPEPMPEQPIRTDEQDGEA